jgi:hypothetical protein
MFESPLAKKNSSVESVLVKRNMTRRLLDPSHSLSPSTPRTVSGVTVTVTAAVTTTTTYQSHLATAASAN